MQKIADCPFTGPKIFLAGPNVFVLKYYSPMNAHGKTFVYEFCVLFTRHKIPKRKLCHVYS